MDTTKMALPAKNKVINKTIFKRNHMNKILKKMLFTTHITHITHTVFSLFSLLSLLSLLKRANTYFLLTFSAALLLLSIANAQGAKRTKTNHVFDIAGVTQRGVLKVAMVESDQVPFFYKKGRSPKNYGLDVSLAETLAKRLNVKVEFNRTAGSFNDLIPKVLSGEVDVVISKLSRTSSRAKQVIFSKPYIAFRQALMVNRIGLARVAPSDEQAAKFLKNFKGKIGIIKDSSYVAYSRINFPNAEVVEFPSWKAVVNAVLTGQVLAGYRDELEIKKVVLTNPDASLRIKTVILTDTKDNIAMALSPESPRLREWINIYLEDAGIFYTAKKIIEEYGKEVVENSK